MANITEKNNGAVAKRNLNPIQHYIATNNIHKQLNNLMGERASQFMLSINNAFETYLAKCDPESVVKSAITAATLNLPIDKNLGFAYLVPYKTSCSFQLGYKGLIQLAQRSGQYHRINAIPIYENQFKGFNPLTEDLELDFSTTPDYKKKPVGYCAYFRLSNGFEKTIYWDYERCVAHAEKFSQSWKYREKYGNIWKENENEMFVKTVLKHAISKYGPLSIDMQKALSDDIESSKKDMPEENKEDKIKDAEKINDIFDESIVDVAAEVFDA